METYTKTDEVSIAAGAGDEADTVVSEAGALPATIAPATLAEADAANAAVAADLAEYRRKVAAALPRVAPAGMHFSDLHSAELLARAHGDQIIHTTTGDWYVWLAGRWVRDPAAVRTMRICSDLSEIISRHRPPTTGEKERDAIIEARWRKAIARAETVAGLEAAVKMLRLHSSIDPQQMDRQPGLLCVANGAIDLKTGERGDHDCRMLITKMAPTYHDPRARCPRWERFIQQIMPDPAVRAFLQRLIGYVASGAASEQIIAIFYGKGANGKSTFIEAIRRVLGDYSDIAATSVIAQQQPEKIRNDLADLAGKRLISISESDEHIKLDEGLIKALSGNGETKARYLFKEFFRFRREFTVILDTNSKPKIKSTDFGMWRRIVLVPFTVTIQRADQDRALAAKLAAETSGILNWLVAGALDYYARGLQIPAAVQASTDEYREQQDEVGRFLDACCVVEATAEAQAGGLYQTYVRWAESEGNEYPISVQSFAASLENKNFERRTVHGRHLWRGLRIGTGGTAIVPGQTTIPATAGDWA